MISLFYWFIGTIVGAASGYAIALLIDHSIVLYTLVGMLLGSTTAITTRILNRSDEEN